MTHSPTRAEALACEIDPAEEPPGDPASDSLARQTFPIEVKAAPLPAPQQLGRLISRDAAMFHAFDLIRTAAPTTVNVLILGENGTGKELAACALHDLSLRNEKPFVKINCAAIPSELLESELFGYRRGAFTGAMGDKKGLFEVAAGGSLLLDEIGEMPTHLQVKLLRVLQDREFMPLGSTTHVKADFRLICATNIDPMEQVRTGRLRKDLYFRLNTISVELPPLRERRVDIPLLAHRFLEQFSERHGRTLRGFEPPAMRALERHAWPGNVRELEHVVERAVILGRGSHVVLGDLAEAVTRPSASSIPRTAQLGGCTLQELERIAILQTLEMTGWNKRATANMLGIHRPTLYNKLRKYRLWRREDRFRKLPGPDANGNGNGNGNGDEDRGRHADAIGAGTRDDNLGG
jgi:two-component system, NtrC family, response regulator HydG